jgi:hypothetical protein
MFDELRLHKDVAPRILELSGAIAGMLGGAEGDAFSNHVADKPLTTLPHNKIAEKITKKIGATEDQNELEAGTRRPRPARSVRAGDGGR